jgi:hypothetical protein
VREQPHLLDHVANLPPQLHRVECADALVADSDVARLEVDQAVDQLQRRGLAAARGPDEHADFPCGDGQRELVDGRLGAPWVALRDALEDDFRGRLA